MEAVVSPEAAVRLAEQLLRDAEVATSRSERRRSQRLGRLLSDPAGRELLFTLTDQVLRAPTARRSMRRLRTLVDEGLPPVLGPVDRIGLRLAGLGSRLAPGPVALAVRARVRAETRGVILPAADPAFARHLSRRRKAGVRVNVNLLGEAILGDDEADARLAAVVGLVRRPDVDHVSVKISALCANLDVLAFDASVDRIAERLRTVYAAALESDPPTFVNLDMEEYRDLDLTVAAFRRVLDEPAFGDLAAGLALQAYVPDSHDVLADLSAWAAERHGRARVRLVKGANLAMERVEAELAGWPQAPYASKAEVDASFKRMLDVALAGPSLGIGAGSHNLFDVAWALVQPDQRVEIEMLEGMAPAQARAVQEEAGSVLLYAPVVAQDDFAASIAYLSRRLDENAGAENFLRALFSLEPGSDTWFAERDRFLAAVADRDRVSTAPRRIQDRTREQRAFDPDEPFANEPDTDFTVAANREWVACHLTEDRPPPRPPLVTTTDGIDDRVARARSAFPGWASTTTAERRALLSRAAEVMAAARGRTIAVMAHETAKTVREGDTEVSEGVDFTRWAAEQTRLLDDLSTDGLTCEPVGPVLVAAPWNFPYAIPTNGVVSALAAGNTVLLKPAPEAVAVGAELVRQLHEAGIPEDVVQLITCPDDDVGRHLVTHDDLGTVVLTGAYETAQLFLDWKPSLRLIAETSGKNALVVTGGADLDLAIRDLVRSAFGHAGQKCSAASLAILDAEVHDRTTFLPRLADAVRSLRVGPAQDLTTMMGPLIGPPTDKLRRALTTLEEGESWLVEPRCLDDERLWSPGVKVGVRPGSWFHQTECFGPVLGVMRARDLDEAIALQNGTPFGLTGGLHSLDPTEIERWTDAVEVGNAYVNRHVTGAIVRRQPFGGWRRSSVGPGAKTGGPDDLLRFVRVGGRAAGGGDLQAWWDRHFGVEQDPSGLAAEANVLRYRPLPRGVLVRAGEDEDDVTAVRAAARLAGTPVAVSPATEDEADLVRRLESARPERLRVLEPVGDGVRRACHRLDVTVDETPATHHGRIELRCWLREQAVSRTRHRHGRIPD